MWVRDGHPRVLTWDADGMVYSIVTRLDDSALEPLLDDLPAPDPPLGLTARVGAGLVRITSWFG